MSLTTSEPKGVQVSERGARPRVAFFNPSLYAVGGMQAWLAGLMPDLRARGWDVWLALPTGPHNDAAAYLRNYPWNPHVLVHNPTCSRLGRLRAVQRMLAAVRPDVLVVANLVTGYRAVEDLRARGERTAKVVACVHTLDPGIFADLQRLAGVIDALVAPNRLIAAAGVELCEIAPERVFYAPYRVEVDLEDGRFHESEAYWAGAGPEAPTLLFAHRLDHHQKRALDLPPLLRALRARGLDLPLEIVGTGSDEEALRAALAGEIREGIVRFLGALSPEDLRRVAARPGRILLVLSAWEMGPIVAWQAMAWGLPVVSSRYLGSGREEFLRDGENALCFPVGDMEAAADAVARLAREPGLAARLVGRARSDAAARFSSESATGAWDASLRSVLALPALPTPARGAGTPPAGRLDRVLGVPAAERVRRLLGWRVATSGPGDEWPHTEGTSSSPSELLRELARLDGATAAPANRRASASRT